MFLCLGVFRNAPINTFLNDGTGILKGTIVGERFSAEISLENTYSHKCVVTPLSRYLLRKYLPRGWLA